MVKFFGNKLATLFFGGKEKASLLKFLRDNSSNLTDLELYNNSTLTYFDQQQNESVDGEIFKKILLAIDTQKCINLIYVDKKYINLTYGNKRDKKYLPISYLKYYFYHLAPNGARCFLLH